MYATSAVELAALEKPQVLDITLGREKICNEYESYKQPIILLKNIFCYLLVKKNCFYKKIRSPYSVMLK